MHEGNLYAINQHVTDKKKSIFLFFGALLFCACEKENADLLIEEQAQFQLDDSALKGAASNGHFKTEFVPPFPFWARMGADAPLGIPSTDEFGIVYFYVEDPLDKVDPDFNLLNFFQGPTPTNLGPADPTIVWAVEGFLWYEAGADPNFDTPVLMHMKAIYVVTFWIITREQVEYLFGTGVITIDDLWDCDPMVGEAAVFNEVLRPLGPEGLIAPVAGIQTSAGGVIVDGILKVNELAQVGSKFNLVSK